MADFIPQKASLPGIAWVNTRRSSSSTHLQAKVTLLHFWHFTNLASLQQLPHVRSLEAQFRPHGLRVLGLLPPKYDFDRLRPNVETAARRLGLRWPIGLDNDRDYAELYDVSRLPTFLLLNSGNETVARGHALDDYTHVSEAAARLLSGEAGATAEPMAPPEIRETSAACPLELDLADLDTLSSAPPAPGEREPSRPILRGPPEFLGAWRRRGRAMLAETTPASIKLHIWAANVYAVLGPSNLSRPEGPMAISLRTGSGPLPASRYGTDVQRAAGKSIVRVDEPRLYHLVRARRAEESTLILETEGPELAFYGLTLDIPTENHPSDQPTAGSE